VYMTPFLLRYELDHRRRRREAGVGLESFPKKGKILVKTIFREHSIHLEIFCFEHSSRFIVPLSNCFALLLL